MEMEGELADCVRYLKKNLGAGVTAYLCGLCNSQNVNSWLRGRRPRMHTELRLRYGYRAVMLVREAYGREAVQSWLFGKNTYLKNCAPIMILRRSTTVTELESVVRAAKSFVSV